MPVCFYLKSHLHVSTCKCKNEHFLQTNKGLGANYEHTVLPKKVHKITKSHFIHFLTSIKIDRMNLLTFNDY